MATAFKQAPSVRFIHPDEMPVHYALKGIGRCMEPLIPDGTLLVFDKEQEARPGDIVGIVFTREAGQRRGVPGWVKTPHTGGSATRL